MDRSISLINAKLYVRRAINKKYQKELQEKVDAADLALKIHSSILYGLLEGSPLDINVEKSLEFLKEGKKYCITPFKVSDLIN